jgi:dTDP-4-dehydrorhamnose 3,5-epimerase
MKFVKQSIPDVLLIEPAIYGDDRGFFHGVIQTRSFSTQLLGSAFKFIQDNESKSFRGVLRGLHFQLPPFAQSKAR